jgi:hypothetical protein
MTRRPCAPVPRTHGPSMGLPALFAPLLITETGVPDRTIAFAGMTYTPVFFLLPHEAFQGGNPLLPTLEGQYAFRNLVLISTGLVIGSTVRRDSVPRSRSGPAGIHDRG